MGHPAIACVTSVLCVAAWSATLFLHWPWRRAQILSAAIVAILVVLGWMIFRSGRTRFRIIAIWSVTATLLAGLAHPVLGWVLSRAEYYPDVSELLPAAILSYQAKGIDEPGRLPPYVQTIREQLDAADHLPVLAHLGLVEGDAANQADAIVANRYQLLNRPVHIMNGDTEWSADPFGDRSWQLALHSLQYLHFVLGRYRETGEPRYLITAETIVIDWVDDNSAWFFHPPSEFSWDDHAVSLRSLVLLEFLKCWLSSARPTEEKARKILRSLGAHASYLGSSKRYFHRHNHGIDADIALLSIAVAIPAFTESARWRATAIERLREQLKETISPSGVHLEHSPSYHLSTLQHLHELHRFARAMQIEEFAGDDVRAMLLKMAEYARLVTMPDGKIVPFGDSRPDQSPSDMPAVTELLAGNLPSALEGKGGFPGLSLRVFENEGYAFLRSSDAGAAGDPAVFLAFTAASHAGLVHKHDDDLSFVLHGRGRPLLVDHGFYGYTPGEFRRYFVSRAAHSTVDFGNHANADFLEGDGSATLVHGEEREGVVALQGLSRVRRAHDHRRTLLFIAPATLVVFDQLGVLSDSSDDVTSPGATIRYHLDPALTARRSPDPARLMVHDRRTGALVMRVDFLSTSRFDAGAPRGKRAPLSGWTSSARSRAEPAEVMEFRGLSAVSSSAARFELVMDCSRPSGCRKSSDTQLMLRDGGLRVAWTDRRGGPQAVDISPSGHIVWSRARWIASMSGKGRAGPIAAR